MLPGPETDSFIALFAELADAPAGARRDRLATLNEADSASAQRLRALLDAHDRCPAFLESPSIRVREDPAPSNGAADGGIPPGTALGDYTIVRRLGAGGMGVVYEARHAALGRTVALKLLSHPWLGEGESRRFQREARLAARLEHEGIARIYEAGTLHIDGAAAPAAFLAMELVDGVPLSQWASEQPRSSREVMEVVRRLALALHYAHERGVLHRDIKPSNILISRAGAPMIIDFGVTRALTADAGASLATESGQLLGTLAYMSPEQLEGGAAPIDQRADVYSLGVVAFELLAGRPPIDVRREPLGRALWRLRHEEPERLVHACHRFLSSGIGAPTQAPISEDRDRWHGLRLPVPRSAIDRDLDAMVTRATARSPTMRYPSAASFSADVARWLEGRPVEARAPSTAYTIWRFAARHKRFVAGVLIAGVLLAATAAVATVQAVRATRAERQALNTSREVIDNLVSSIQLSRAGAETRRRTLENLRPGIEALLRDAGSSPEVRAAAGRYYVQLGAVLGGPEGPSFGDGPGAETAFVRAASIVSPDGPGEFQTEEEALVGAHATFALAHLWYANGRFSECENPFRDVIHWARLWSGKSSDTFRWWVLEGRAASILTIALMQEGRRDEAEAIAREIEAAFERACEKPPSANPSEHCGDVLFFVGKIWFESGSPERAVAWFVRARSEYERRAGADAPVEEVFDLGDSARYEALCRDRMGQHEQALRLLDRALDIYAGAATNYPERVDGMSVRAHTLGYRAEIRARLGDSDALDDVREAIAIREKRFVEDGGVGGSVSVFLLTLGSAENASRELLRAGIEYDSAGRSVRDFLLHVQTRRSDLQPTAGRSPIN